VQGFLPAAKQLYGGRRHWIFMQDNAPSHTAGSTQRILRNHRVKVLDWPANIPDLNPIEIAWAIVQHRLRKKAPATFAGFKAQLQSEWNLEQSTIEKLINSM